RGRRQDPRILELTKQRAPVDDCPEAVLLRASATLHDSRHVRHARRTAAHLDRQNRLSAPENDGLTARTRNKPKPQWTSPGLPSSSSSATPSSPLAAESSRTIS